MVNDQNSFSNLIGLKQNYKKIYFIQLTKIE